MELALNNFEVLDQTQMEEIDGDGVYGDILYVMSCGCQVAAAVTSKNHPVQSAVFTGLSVVYNVEARICDRLGW